ncbi:MAG: hypothetical protein KJ064_24270 [Anaerolineae bacterium]|nr:hypothetical protein [Anaerolineae bacterium]
MLFHRKRIRSYLSYYKIPLSRWLFAILMFSMLIIVLVVLVLIQMGVLA